MPTAADGEDFSTMQKRSTNSNPYFLATSRNLLLILTRNPELGKCKTRLAATIGDQAALDVYKILLDHTAHITQELPCDKHVYYSERIIPEDIWDNEIYVKKLQQGADLGQRMQDAFQSGFNEGYIKVVVIGSDMYDLDHQDIMNAFAKLDDNDAVLGPAEDGGYYLLGMKQLFPSVFQSKNWGTDTVFEDTMKDLQDMKVGLLDERNDVDRYEDILGIPVFEPFLIDLRP